MGNFFYFRAFIINHPKMWGELFLEKYFISFFFFFFLRLRVGELHSLKYKKLSFGKKYWQVSHVAL